MGIYTILAIIILFLLVKNQLTKSSIPVNASTVLSQTGKNIGVCANAFTAQIPVSGPIRQIVTQVVTPVSTPMVSQLL
jgi:hypothetical protein